MIVRRKSKITDPEEAKLLTDAQAQQDALLLGAKPDAQKTEEELRASGMDSSEVDARVSMRDGGQSIYKKATNKEANLNDFEIKKLIGQGTFGKVFLVQHPSTGVLYAMKCIRKDLILEHNQLANISMEKNILNSVDHPFLVNMEYVF